MRCALEIETMGRSSNSDRGLQFGQVEPPVQCGESCRGGTPRPGVMYVVDVEVYDVETRPPLDDFLEHQQMRREMVGSRLAEAERRSHAGTSSAAVTESPLAKRVTSWPRETSSSVR